MKPVSAEVTERSRKYLSLALQRIASVGQKTIADQLETSESTVSRFVSGDLERACQLLAAIGLKVVPRELRCYAEQEIEAIFTLAKASMVRMDGAKHLSFDDDDAE